MRRARFVIAALLAACASSPVAPSSAATTAPTASSASVPARSFTSEDVRGYYRYLVGPDEWEELQLESDGRCTSWWCVAWGAWSRTRSTGRWSLIGGTVRVVMDPPHESYVDKSSLIARRWQGHVYLVPRADIPWFDAHGPYEEFCFHALDAPLAPMSP